MKKSELIFNMISVLVDFVMILIAGTVAYFLRYQVETLPVLFNLSFQQYLQLIILPAVFLLILFAWQGLYTQKSTRGIWSEVGRIITAVSAGLMIVVFLFFFNRNLFPSRLIILMAWVLVIFLVSLSRMILLVIQRKLMERGFGQHNLVVIDGNSETTLIQEIKLNPRWGYNVVMQTAYVENALEEIERLHRKIRVDEVLLTDSDLSSEKTLKLIGFCEQLGIKFNYLPNILEAHKSKVETDVIGSNPVIRLKATPLDGWGRVVKRLVDIIISAVGLIITAPLMLVTAVAIKLDSKGPVFFHQKRGSSFHSFEFYKFRTMRADLSEGTPEGDRIRKELESQNVRGGPYVKIKNDPRVTRVGRVLRKTKIDELPQLWHIMTGKMSLVGPRIHMIKEVEKFEERQKKLFTNVKPGATGLTQINQYTNPELPFEEEIRLDLFYIENWSVWLDLYIIAKTLVLLLTRRPQEDY